MKNIDSVYTPEKMWIEKLVQLELGQDIPDEDLTSLLIDEGSISCASIITREEMILCGIPYVEAILDRLCSKVKGSYPEIIWHAKDGDKLDANEPILTISGNTRVLLSAERSMLNILQTLSATATTCRKVSKWVENSKTKILDTRKTIPALRLAQKYAVSVGGCSNHRFSLSDAFLIKENHILCCGTIGKAIERAKSIRPNAKTWIEIEVENIKQMKEAIKYKPERIMLDNFSNEMLEKAVKTMYDLPESERIPLEVSGINFNEQNIKYIASLGVDFISIGALTKNLQAIDLSMRINSHI